MIRNVASAFECAAARSGARVACEAVRSNKESDPALSEKALGGTLGCLLLKGWGVAQHPLMWNLRLNQRVKLICHHIQSIPLDRMVR